MKSTCWDTRATDPIIKSGQSDTEVSIQCIKFNISTAIVGRINQNGIVTFDKMCHLPRAGMALICTVIKMTTGARAGRP